MASTQVNPTRMELTKQKTKLVTAVRGHKLLKDKRDELMRQFLDLVRENMELRKKVEAGIRSANTNFVIAKAGMSEETLNTALISGRHPAGYASSGRSGKGLSAYGFRDRKNKASCKCPGACHHTGSPSKH